MADIQNRCDVCQKDAKLRCGRCKSVYYCTVQCQRNGWKVHKTKCNKPLNEGTKFYNEAFRFFNQERFAQSIISYTKALKFDPDNYKIFTARGAAYALSSNYSFALKDYTKGLEILEGNEQIKRAKVILHVKRGEILSTSNKEHLKAIEDFTEGLRIEEEYKKDSLLCYEAYFGRGLAYNAISEDEKAIEDYTKALKIQKSGDKAELYNFRAVSYSSLGKYKRALTDFSKSIELDPNNISAINNRGVTFSNMKMYERSIVDFTKCIKLGRNDYNSLFNRACSYSELGDLTNSIRDFTRCISLSPENHNAYLRRAAIYSRRRNDEKSLEDYLKVISLQPDNFEAFNLLGITLARLGRIDDAIEHYQKAVELNHEYAPAFFNLANEYSKRKKFKLAIENFSKAIVFHPEDEVSYYNRATCYIHTKEIKKAIDDLNKMNITPEYADGYFMKGYCFHLLGNTEQAIDELMNLVKFSFGYDLCLSILYDKFNRYREIRRRIEHYNKFLAKKYNVFFSVKNEKDMEMDISLFQKDVTEITNEYFNLFDEKDIDPDDPIEIRSRKKSILEVATKLSQKLMKKNIWFHFLVDSETLPALPTEKTKRNENNENKNEIITEEEEFFFNKNKKKEEDGVFLFSLFIPEKISKLIPFQILENNRIYTSYVTRIYGVEGTFILKVFNKKKEEENKNKNNNNNKKKKKYIVDKQFLVHPNLGTLYYDFEDIKELDTTDFPENNINFQKPQKPQPKAKKNKNKNKNKNKTKKTKKEKDDEFFQELVRKENLGGSRNLKLARISVSKHYLKTLDDYISQRRTSKMRFLEIEVCYILRGIIKGYFHLVKHKFFHLGLSVKSIWIDEVFGSVIISDFDESLDLSSNNNIVLEVKKKAQSIKTLNFGVRRIDDFVIRNRRILKSPELLNPVRLENKNKNKNNNENNEKDSIKNKKKKKKKKNDELDEILFFDFEKNGIFLIGLIGYFMISEVNGEINDDFTFFPFGNKNKNEDNNSINRLFNQNVIDKETKQEDYVDLKEVLIDPKLAEFIKRLLIVDKNKRLGFKEAMEEIQTLVKYYQNIKIPEKENVGIKL